MEKGIPTNSRGDGGSFSEKPGGELPDNRSFMTTAVADTHGLIPELCRQFSLVTGWPMHFTPLHRSPAELRRELENQPECLWLAEVGNGHRPAGFLHLEAAGDGAGADSFVEATMLAETLAQILGRLAQATTQLNQRNHDVATLLNLGLAVPGQDDLAFCLTQLLQAAAHLTGSWSAAFFLLEASTERLRLRAVYNLSREDVPQPFRELRSDLADLRALSNEPVILRTKIPGDHPLFPSEMRTGICAAVESETAPFGTLVGL